ncbi:SPOSA6832_03624, partial [Sporobolomyces salmonicolor]
LLTPPSRRQAPASIEAIVAESTRLAEQFVSVRPWSSVFPLPVVLSDVRSFCSRSQRYYAAQDADPADRPTQIHPLYAATARVTWNGNPVAVADLPAFVQQMPKSHHDVQAFDCHPIAGNWRSPLPRRDGLWPSPSSPLFSALFPSLTVSHGPFPTPSAGSINSKNFDHLPRVFSQSFILSYNPAGDPSVGEGGYLIAADSFRFC